MFSVCMPPTNLFLNVGGGVVLPLFMFVCFGLKSLLPVFVGLDGKRTPETTMMASLSSDQSSLLLSK